MSIPSLLRYDVYFSDSGAPKTGLLPVAILKSHTTGSLTSGIVAEVGNGWYMLYTSGSGIGGDVYVGYVDGGLTTLSNIDRFIPVRVGPYDFALDGYVADIPTNVDTKLSSIHGSGLWTESSSGSGANSVTITVKDVDSLVPVTGVLVNCYNSDESALISYGTTNNLGQVGFLLSTDTYKVRLAKYSTYTFTNPQTLTVSGATTVTYTGTLIVPTPAPTTETCNVSGRCLDGRGYAIVGCLVQANVIGSFVTYLDTSGAVTSIGSDPVRTTTDSNGLWTLTLIRSRYLYRDDVSGVGYHVTLKGRGMDESKDITVPDALTAKYEDL